MDTQKREEQLGEAEEQKRQPLWRQVRPAQILLTGGSLLASGAADAALHLDATGVFLGLLLTFVVARHSNDILEALVPGQDAASVVATTERVVNAAAPQTSLEDEQAVGAKLRRLFFLKSRMPAHANEVAEVDTILIPEEEALAAADRHAMEPLQPKLEQPDTAQQSGTNESECAPATGPIFPAYPDRVTLRLGQAIDKPALQALILAHSRDQIITVPGRRFDPPFKLLLGKGWVAAANQGFGKSILNGVIIEQAGKCGVPAIVLDHKGEYGTVRELAFMNALLAGAGGSIDFRLTVENVDAFVERVVTGRYQAIVNLPSYGSNWLGKARVSAAIGQALMRYAEYRLSQGQKLLPTLVIMDEAQLYLPQDQSLLPPEALENKTVLSDLKNAYFALVSNGRTAGYTVGFATQSLTYLAKWAIKSSQVRIFGRHAEKNDLDTCEQIINPAIATREQIEAFPPGVGVVFGFTTKPMIVQFDKKQARDLAQTPGMEALLYHEAPAPLPYAPMAGQFLPRSAQPAPAPSPYYQPAQPYQPPVPQAGRSALPEQIAFQYPGQNASPYRPGAAPRTSGLFAPEPYAQPAQPGLSAQAPVSWQEAEKSQHQHFTKAVGPELQAAYTAYRPGMHHHTLARALGTTPSVAGHLLKQLQLHGLIDAAGKKTVVSPQVSQEDLREYDRAVTIWHELKEKKRANVRDFAAAMHMGETKAWDLLRELDRLGLIHWERRKKRDVV
jgi:hypothetical protein